MASRFATGGCCARRLACVLALAACGEERELASRPHDAGDDAALADAAPAAEPYLPVRPPEPDPDADSGPAAPVNPATNPNPPGDAGSDAATPDAARPQDCLWVEPGESLQIAGMLVASQLWTRIEPDAGCPAMALTAQRVAYATYPICPHARPRVLDIAMRGADLLDDSEAVADPLLVVYRDADSMLNAPFACIAANDDGLFDGLSRNSARVIDLTLAAGEPALLVATSRERPDQRGLGAFELSVAAR